MENLDFISCKQLPETKKFNDVISTSGELLIQLKNGDLVAGRLKVIDQDLDKGHKTAKKGDIFWMNLKGQHLEDVVSYKIINELN